MPTSATGTSSKRRRRSRTARDASGFTLLEVLVVVVIIGIITSMAMLSIHVLGGDHEMQQEAERLQAILTQAREDAMLESRDLGMRLDDAGFDFLEYDGKNERWHVIQDDSLLRERTLPEGLHLSLRLEDHDIQLKKRQPETDRDPIQPQIVLQASGDLSPFDVNFSRDGTAEHRRVNGTDKGKIELHDDARERR
jgi:general secretion pathway protein H